MDKKIDLEGKLGALFGFVAIVAIIAEMALGGFSLEAIVGGIKDIAGTIVTVLVFIVAVSQFKKRNAKGFDNVFNAEMNSILEKYSPMINHVDSRTVDKKYADLSRFDIASKLDCISTNNPGAYHFFFAITHNEVSKISFRFTKTVFGERKDTVAVSVENKILKNFSDIIYESKRLPSDDVEFTFKEILSTDDEAKELARIVDCVLLVCVAEYGVKEK